VLLKKGYYRFTLANGLQVAELTYQAAGWSNPRRCVVVRKHKTLWPELPGKEIKGLQPALFEDEAEYRNYRYSAFYTDLDLPAAEIWRLYRGRADSENRIKELKTDFGLDSFNLDAFYATEAALSVAILAYNLYALMRLTLGPGKTRHTLSVMRFKHFAIAGYMQLRNGKRTLVLSLKEERRPRFERLRETVQNATFPLTVEPIFSIA
jgi:Transposase DDE domain group 1